MLPRQSPSVATSHNICMTGRHPINNTTLLNVIQNSRYTWWHHQMETISAVLALCAGNSPVTSEFPSQRPVTRSFDVFFDLCLNKRLSKQSWGLWCEMPWRSLWRHRNDVRKWDRFDSFVVVSAILFPMFPWEETTLRSKMNKSHILEWCAGCSE